MNVYSGRRARTETYLVSGLAYCERTTDVCCTTAIYDSIVHNKIPHRADRIVQCPLRLVNDLDSLGVRGQSSKRHEATYHFVASAHKNRDCPRVGALLDDEHLIACRAKGEFSNDSSATELFRREVLEARNDATVGRDCDQLNGP